MSKWDNLREEDDSWSFPSSSTKALSRSTSESVSATFNDVQQQEGCSPGSSSSSPRNGRLNNYLEKRNNAAAMATCSYGIDDEDGEGSGYRFNRVVGHWTRQNGDTQKNSKNKNLDNPMERSARSALMQQLLEAVCESVTTFRPSASISALVSMVGPLHTAQPDIEIDVVITGGGMKGYFMAGASHVLLRELDKQNVKIARVAGASAGAWGGLFIMTGFSAADWIETYFVCARNLDKTLLEAYVEIWPFVQTLIPPDAYKQCTGRLFISVTEITMWGLQNRIISEYTSNEDLFQACLASSSIPYLTIRGNYFLFRNKWILDGGFTNNTPVFEDGKNRQLIFSLYNVEYPWRQLTVASDSCIEALVIRGAICMSRFLQGEATDSISWLERKEKKDNKLSLRRPGHVLRRLVITPLVVGSMMLFHGLGLAQHQFRHKRREREQLKRSGSTIVPFDQMGEKRDSPISYLRRVLWGSVVDALQRMNVLL